MKEFAPLHIAVVKRQPKLISQLLSEGADINEKPSLEIYQGLAPLHTAIRLQFVDITKLLLDRGADPNVLTNNGIAPLHIACAGDYPSKAILIPLKKAGLDIKLKPEGGKSIVKIVKLLLKAGADINLRDQKKNTPLQYACFKENLDIMKILIGAGADIDTKNHTGLTPIHTALGVSRSMDLLKLLIDSKANVNIKHNTESIPLHWAVLLESISLSKMLIDAGSDINAGDVHLRTPLHVATTKSNNVDLYKLLLKAGANLQAKDACDYTPLHCAAQYSRSCNIFKLLVDSGSNVNEKSVFNGFTPLHEAAQKSRNINIVKFLLKSGAKVNAESNNKNTPLHIAAQRSNSNSLVKLLLDAGANIHAKNDRGYNPLQGAAMESTNVNILKTLLMYGADIKARDDLGNTAIHFAILGNKINNLEVLVKAGLDVNGKGRNAETPLQMACYSADLKTINFLIKSGADASQLIYHDNNVTFDYFIVCLKTIIKDENKNLVENTFKFIIEGFDINLVDSEQNFMLYKILYAGFSKLQNKFFNKLIVEHVAKLKVLNLHVSNILDWFSTTTELDHSKHFTNCVEELVKAKSTRLHNSWVTFLNLLVDEDHKFVKYAGNEDLVNDFKKTDLKRTFPIFGEKMEDNMNNGIYQRKLFDTAANQLCYYFPMFNSYHLIIRDTLNALSKEDWKKLSQRKRYKN